MNNLNHGNPNLQEANNQENKPNLQKEHKEEKQDESILLGCAIMRYPDTFLFNSFI